MEKNTNVGKEEGNRALRKSQGIRNLTILAL
jgi:hypothetical protein